MKIWMAVQTVVFQSLSVLLVFHETHLPLETLLPAEGLLAFERLLPFEALSLSVWIYVLALHILACVSFCTFCWLSLPKTYQHPMPSTISFLFVFNLLLPVIGMVGTVCSILPALYRPHTTNNTTWYAIDESPLPQEPNSEDIEHFGTGALRDILLYDPDPKRHLEAIAAIRNLPRKIAVPMLQLAMKDPCDDVRLLAYSSLERIETEINESIAWLKNQFSNNKTAINAYEIAQQYWELCYLNIAEGALLNHYLQEAERYLTNANEIKETSSANLLLGRVFLKQNRPADALLALNLARAGGLKLSQVSPYLAEAAFMNRDYKSVRDLVNCFPEQQSGRLCQIKEYWQ